MNPSKFSTLEEIIEGFKTQELAPEESHSLIMQIEQKIKADFDLLFAGLAGGHIHEIQSKIGYAKNILNLVIESKGAFDHKRALESIIIQLQDILALYRKSGVSTQL